MAAPNEPAIDELPSKAGEKLRAWPAKPLAPSIESELPQDLILALYGEKRVSISSSTSTTAALFDPLIITAWENQELLMARVLTSVDIIEMYLKQIEQHNRRGRQLRALISVAPKHELLKIAKNLDHERAQGRARSPLHGIPIVLKDNIMTDMTLGMDTTVGSYAFVGAIPRKNATIVERLQKKGMIILGKSNMTEFCAVSVAAGFSTLAIGTDTIGSLITPANRAALYALKPTVGEIPMDGVFTLGKTFDTAGGMAKSAKDLVHLMDALMLPSRHEYEMGVHVITPVELLAPSALNLEGRNCFEPIVYHEFKDTLNSFIKDFKSTKVHSLAEIINLNLEHPELCLPPKSPNQDDLTAAAGFNSGVLTESVQTAREHLQNENGLERLLEEHECDIICAPGDSALSSLAAAAGWPTAVAPLGAPKLNGQPFGLVLTSPPHTEHLLLQFLTAYEATFPPRAQPLPLHTVPFMSPDEELLPDKPIVEMILHEWDTRRFSCSADALAD
ncbi:amidase signature enzyme [Lophium mytilinum]|uniref:Amidase signature enzyme n=1 Tax=Lophium mytilinum TaxID=390894 RepID=A0A6A6R2N4_9PEZI|nr:amidase signature enzyme [Lophium mytilinum]